MLSDLIEKKSVASNAVQSSENLPLDQMSQDALKNFKNRSEPVDDGDLTAGPDKHELKFHTDLIDPKHRMDDKKTDSDDALFKKYMWNNVDAVNEVPDDNNKDLTSNPRFEELLPTEEFDELIAELDWDPNDLAELGQETFTQNSFGLRSARTNPSAVYAESIRTTERDSKGGGKIKRSAYTKLLQANDRIEKIGSIEGKQRVLRQVLERTLGGSSAMLLGPMASVAKVVLQIFGPEVIKVAQQSPDLMRWYNTFQRTLVNYGFDNLFGTRPQYDAPSANTFI